MAMHLAQLKKSLGTQEREVGAWHHSYDHLLTLGCQLHAWAQSLPIGTGEAMHQEVSKRLTDVEGKHRPSHLFCAAWCLSYTRL